MANLIALFEKAYNKPSVPLFIEGAPGCGKTQQVRQFAKALEAKLQRPFPLITMQLSSMDETDLSGMPKLNEDGTTSWGRPSWVDKLQNGGILFLDEINCGRKSVMDTALTLIQNRVLPTNGATIPETVLIIAAYNPAALCDNTDFNPALLNRGMVVSWNPTISDWAGWFLGSGTVTLDNVAVNGQLTLQQWEDRWFGRDKNFELDKRVLFSEALKEGLQFADVETIEPNTTFTSSRSVENLFYWADNATQVVQWAPAFLDKKGAEIFAKISATIYQNVTNAIFGNGGNTADNAEETSRLNTNKGIIDRIKAAAEN